jgi:glycosyltransferase involved in cell wall biosynthesis
MTSSGQPILISANSSWNLLNFRLPIIEALMERGYRVAAAVPSDKAAVSLVEVGVDVHNLPIDARGLSPVGDARLLFRYWRLMRRLRPSAFLGFTVKPNIYGSIAAAHLGVPAVNTVTGLGTAFLSGRALELGVASIYRYAFRKSERVFFHNPDDRDLFVSRKLIKASQASVVAGSGIDLRHFSATVEVEGDRPPTFLFVGRLLKDKGVKEFAEAAAIVRETTSARFQILGSVEDHPKAVSGDVLDPFISNGVVELLGQTEDVRPFIRRADCVVLPSYREGLPRVLLEASAMGKPVIATDVPGCRHAVEEGRTGLLCEPRSSQSLARALLAFLEMSPEDRSSMGLSGRRKAESQFSSEQVAAAYIDALERAGI